MSVDHGRQRRDRADDALAERDDGKEAVPLGNVMRVPGRAAGLTLGEHGAGHFNEYEDAAEDDGGGGRQRNGVAQGHLWRRAATETPVPRA